MSRYDFDQITDRRNTGSLKWDVAENELPMWVADMDFQTAPAVREAIEKRAVRLHGCGRRLVSCIHGLVGETPSVFHQKRMVDLLYRCCAGDLKYGPQADNTGRKRADPDTGVQYFL